MEKSIGMGNNSLTLKEIQNIMDTPLGQVEASRVNPLVLAYIGDAVFEIHIRRYLIGTHKTQVNQLHKRATKFVKADAQSNMIHHLIPDLTEEELVIVKRGRNSKSNTTPKNASLSDYRYATGFEALLGYLYLSGDGERLMEMISRSIELVENGA